MHALLILSAEPQHTKDLSLAFIFFIAFIITLFLIASLLELIASIHWHMHYRDLAYEIREARSAKASSQLTEEILFGQHRYIEDTELDHPRSTTSI